MTQPPLKTRRSSDDFLSDDHTTCGMSCDTNRSSSLTYSSLNHESPMRVYFQQSLLVLIQFHFIRRLSKKSFNRGFSDYLLPCIQNVGYVSHRFFESFVSAVKIFVETNTFDVAPVCLPLLSSIASLFGAKIQSVKRHFEYPFITSLKAEISSFLPHLLDCSSSFYLSRLRRLDITIGDAYARVQLRCFPVIRHDEVTNKTHTDAFNSFCKSLMNNTTVTELTININCLKSCDFNSFAEVFGSNKTLKALCLCFKVSPKYEESLLLYNSIAINSGIEKIDLTKLSLNSTKNPMFLHHCLTVPVLKVSRFLVFVL
ncbi:hypothetical protein GEMRC1_008932 [Eukaryota sp. GEM-RC1]